MNIKKEPQYYFDEESGVAGCVLFYNDKEIEGSALCHPQDEDMKSEKVGCHIAESRALTKYYKVLREETIVSLRALNEYYDKLKKNEYYDENSFPVILLKQTIEEKEKELKEIRALIKEEQKELYTYINLKDKMYVMMRAMRAEKAKKEGQNK